MRLIALDAATSAASCAVAIDGEIAAYRQAPLGRGVAEEMPPMARACLDDAGLAVGDLDQIATTIGPGGFTGVRVAVALARGLGLRDPGASQTAVVGASTGRVMAAQFAQSLASAGVVGDARLLASLVDVRRGGLFLEMFDARARPLSAGRLVNRKDAPGEVATAALGLGGEAQPLIVIGAEADDVARELVGAATRIKSISAAAMNQIDARALARLAPSLAPESDPAIPIYARPPDAAPAGASKVVRAVK
ncbi:MAG: tRNA (adenosine(37)-N6)-threonylcarbamoyltransferase complex dimerization subunit type 1 TsaB [Pseudomonadota bacterium]